MKRLVIGISLMALVLGGCAEATDGSDGEEAGVDVATGESIPEEWLDDPETPLGNVVVYADGERLERFTLYSHHLGEEVDTSENCTTRNHHSLCGVATIMRCDGENWRTVDSHAAGVDCRHLTEVNHMLEDRLKKLQDDDGDGCFISMRFDRFENRAGANDPAPYTQPGEPLVNDGTTSGGATDPTSPNTGDRTGTGGHTDPGSDLDSTSGTTQPGTSSGTSSGGSSSSGSSGSTSGGSSGGGSGGSSTTQPARY